MRKGESKFYDTANFPHGFSRSGFFTIKETEVLETFGKTLKALSDGIEQPQDADEKTFVTNITEQTSTADNYAKVWKKYLKHTNTKVRLLTLSGGTKVEPASADETTELIDEE